MSAKRKWLMFAAPLVLATLACTCGLTQQLGNLAANQAEQLAEGAQATAEAMAGESMATVQAQVEAEAGAEAGGDTGGDTGEDSGEDLGNLTFGGDASDLPFPVPDDPSVNVVLQTDAMINYIVEMSLDDLLAYYRDELSAQGYTEREGLTVVEQGTASLVFDGDPSGQALVVQMVDLGDGTVNVNVRLEDM